MACRLFGTEALPEPMLIHRHLDYLELIPLKINVNMQVVIQINL